MNDACSIAMPNALLSEADRDYWREQARRIEWHAPFTEVSRLVNGGPRREWFADGLTNLCHNAVDRHLKERGEHTALIHIDSDDREQRFSYHRLHREVQVIAAILEDFGIEPGDRVAIYLPMIPQALIAMLACARIGAVHVVIFAGLPTSVISARLDAVCPKLLITADGGLDGRRWRCYRPLLAKALARTASSPSILMIDRGLDDGASPLPRETAYDPLYQRFANADVACNWLSSQSSSHILHTSGTQGRPKGVVRDTGGYAVALATSMETVYETQEHDIVFTSADIGWVVGHSYLVYAPLLSGLTTVMMEGGPCHTGPSRWWQAIERLGITHLLAAPTAIRQLRQAHVGATDQADLHSLRRIFLAGEPLDASTASWLRDMTATSVIDHYWQTESGWPILAGDSRAGGLLPVANRRVVIIDDQGSRRDYPGLPGSIVIEDHLSPGGMLTLWQDDDLHDELYWVRNGDGHWRYATHDWGVVSAQGRLQILGRTDDVINVGGRRLSTAEIEHIVLGHPDVADAAVVGKPHPRLGQVPVLYVVLSASAALGAIPPCLRQQLRDLVVSGLGRHAQPRHVRLLDNLPRTRSGKIHRQLIESINN